MSKTHSNTTLKVVYINSDYYLQIRSADNKPEHVYNVVIKQKMAKQIAEQEGLEIETKLNLQGKTL
jgi:hypothetical protein